MTDRITQLPAPPEARDDPAHTIEALNDQLQDQAIELDMLREALGVPYEPHQSLLERMLEAARGRAGSGAAPEPPASMLTQRKLTRAINALGIDSRASTPDYVLSDAIWAYLHGMPAKSLPAQPRRPYGTATMSEYGVIPECDGPKPPAQQPMGAEEIASACYTYRHDFGLLPEVERHLLMAEARRWAAAFGMEVER